MNIKILFQVLFLISSLVTNAQLKQYSGPLKEFEKHNTIENATYYYNEDENGNRVRQGKLIVVYKPTMYSNTIDTIFGNYLNGQKNGKWLELQYNIRDKKLYSKIQYSYVNGKLFGKFEYLGNRYKIETYFEDDHLIGTYKYQSKENGSIIGYIDSNGYATGQWTINYLKNRTQFSSKFQFNKGLVTEQIKEDLSTGQKEIKKYYTKADLLEGSPIEDFIDNINLDSAILKKELILQYKQEGISGVQIQRDENDDNDDNNDSTFETKSIILKLENIKKNSYFTGWTFATQHFSWAYCIYNENKPNVSLGNSFLNKSINLNLFRDFVYNQTE